MKPFCRSVAVTAAAPLSGRPAVRWYRQGSVRSRSQDPSVVSPNGMMTMPAPRVTVPSPCPCRGFPIHPTLQIRRGAARSSGGKARRSPTVRQVERQSKRSSGPAPAPGGSGGGGSGSGSAFPDDLATLLPALDAAMEALGSTFTQQECLDVLAASQRVTQSHIAVNEAALARDYNLTPYKLHAVAVLLLFGSSSAADSGRCFALATSLLHLASTSGVSKSRPGGYLPSTLTLLNMLGVDRPQTAMAAQATRMRQSRIYLSAEEQFLAYLARHNSASSQASPPPLAKNDLAMQANAFTLAGVLAESAGDVSRALRWHRAARDVGREISPTEGEEVGEADEDVQPREPKWSWERRCLEAIGRLQAAEVKAAGGIQRQTASYREAKGALRTAALALNSGEACLLLATEYSDDSGTPVDDSRKQQQEQELETMLHRAAVGAIPGACEALAEREEKKVALAAQRGAEGAGTTKRQEEASYHQMLADEWRRIAAASAAADMSS